MPGRGGVGVDCAFETIGTGHDCSLKEKKLGY